MVWMAVMSTDINFCNKKQSVNSDWINPEKSDFHVLNSIVVLCFHTLQLPVPIFSVISCALLLLGDVVLIIKDGEWRFHVGFVVFL